MVVVLLLLVVIIPGIKKNVFLFNNIYYHLFIPDYMYEK